MISKDDTCRIIDILILDAYCNLNLFFSFLVPIKRPRKSSVPDDTSSFTTDSLDSKSHKPVKHPQREKSKRASNKPKKKVYQNLLVNFYSLSV